MKHSKLYLYFFLIVFSLLTASCQCNSIDGPPRYSGEELDKVQVTLFPEGAEIKCHKWLTVAYIVISVVVCIVVSLLDTSYSYEVEDKINVYDREGSIIGGIGTGIFHTVSGAGSPAVLRAIAGFLAGILILLPLFSDATLFDVGNAIKNGNLIDFLFDALLASILLSVVHALIWAIPYIGHLASFLEYTAAIIFAIIIIFTPTDLTRKEREYRREQRSYVKEKAIQESRKVSEIAMDEAALEDEGVIDKVLSWGKEKYESASSFVEEKSQSVSESLKEKKAQKESGEDTSSEEKPNIFKRLWGWIKDKIPNKEE